MRKFVSSWKKGSVRTISHEALGIQTVVLAGVEPAISVYDASYNMLQGRQRELWLDLLFEVSTDPTTIGASTHLLYIGRKSESSFARQLSPEPDR